ncbi:hypothetical protein [Phormidium sp. FACHB-1136]|uniref:hypothetical protein n=1 Tax=Phormidium sp. FACHB-1136 TaxID=2692848 RepID=UPI001681D1CA|nr:hypothetical protein [Phormidium sp. FACHB-1136]MBD2425011.1 hypothetical protein [Phormidium sp. FACHB-1136]
MPIDLAPIKSAISSALTGQDITPQVSSSGSQLTIVLNRQHGKSAEYESLRQKIMDALCSLDISGLDLIKFYGRETGRQPEWQMKAHLSKDGQDTNPFSLSGSNTTSVNQQLTRINTPIAASQSTAQSSSETGPNIFMILVSWSMFAVGILMMGVGLVYETAPRDSYGSRTHNIGLINAKETYTHTGGYLAVSGAILVHHFSSKRSCKR